MALVGRQLGAAGADRGEELVDRLRGQLLEGPGPAVADPLGDLDRRPGPAQGRQHDQIGHLRAGDRVVGDAPVGVRLGLPQGPGRLVGAHAQLNGVAPRLAHLLPVQSQQHRRLAQQRLRTAEDRAVRHGPPVAPVEALGDQARLLQVRELVLAHGHQIGLAEQDVGGLMDRIGQQQPAHGAPVGGLQLGLDGGVAVQLGLGDQGQEGQHELIGRRHRRVGEDRRTLRVHAHRQGVGHQGQDALADGAHGVAVGDDLVVGHEDPRVHAAVLDRPPRVHGAEVVAQVHIARGAHAGEHAVAAGVDVQVGLDLGAAGDRAGQGGVVGGGGQGLLGGRGGGGRGRSLGHGAILMAVPARPGQAGRRRRRAGSRLARPVPVRPGPAATLAPRALTRRIEEQP